MHFHYLYSWNSWRVCQLCQPAIHQGTRLKIDKLVKADANLSCISEFRPTNWIQLANIIKISRIKAKPLSEHLPAELWSSFFCLLGKGTSWSRGNFLIFWILSMFCSIANAMAQVLPELDLQLAVCQGRIAHSERLVGQNRSKVVQLFRFVQVFWPPSTLETMQ